MAGKVENIFSEEQTLPPPATASADALDSKKQKSAGWRKARDRLGRLFDVWIPSDDDDESLLSDTDSEAEATGRIKVDVSESDEEYNYNGPLNGRYMNEAETAEYNGKIEESKGFDLPKFDEDVTFPCDIIHPIHPTLLTERCSYLGWARYAIETHQKNTGENFQLVEVVKANQKGGRVIDLYFTLQLKDETGVEKIYRVKLSHDFLNFETGELHLFEQVLSNEGSETKISIWLRHVKCAFLFLMGSETKISETSDLAGDSGSKRMRLV